MSNGLGNRGHNGPWWHNGACEGEQCISTKLGLKTIVKQRNGHWLCMSCVRREVKAEREAIMAENLKIRAKRERKSGAIEFRGNRSWRLKFRVRGRRIVKTIHADSYEEADNVASLVISACQILNDELEIALCQKLINDLIGAINARYTSIKNENAGNVGQIRGRKNYRSRRENTHRFQQNNSRHVEG